mgnify:FL=1|jgi:hypothetical protein
MTTITITAQILDGNLGDGWRDNYEAAQALAEFMEQRWRDDLAELAAEGHEVDIQIDVQSAEGCVRETIVDADDADLAARAERLLTDRNRIWERFCSSPEAEALAE